jgi:hypothetical protein
MPAKGGQPHGQSSLLLDARPQALMSVLYTPAGNVLLQPEKVDPFRLRCFLLLAARIADYRSSWAAQSLVPSWAVSVVSPRSKCGR